MILYGNTQNEHPQNTANCQNHEQSGLNPKIPCQNHTKKGPKTAPKNHPKWGFPGHPKMAKIGNSPKCRSFNGVREKNPNLASKNTPKTGVGNRVILYPPMQKRGWFWGFSDPKNDPVFGPDFIISLTLNCQKHAKKVESGKIGQKSCPFLGHYFGVANFGPSNLAKPRAIRVKTQNHPPKTEPKMTPNLVTIWPENGPNCTPKTGKPPQNGQIQCTSGAHFVTYPY